MFKNSIFLKINRLFSAIYSKFLRYIYRIGIRKKGERMSIEQIDRNNIKSIRNAISNALKEVEEEYGLTIRVGNISYSLNEANVKVKVSVGTDTTQIARNEWDRGCRRFSLTPEMFGKEFYYMAGLYKIVGIKTRSRKYPVLAQSMRNGKVFKMSDYVVRNALKEEK